MFSYKRSRLAFGLDLVWILDAIFSPKSERFCSVSGQCLKSEQFDNRTIFRASEIRTFGFWTPTVYTVWKKKNTKRYLGWVQWKKKFRILSFLLIIAVSQLRIGNLSQAGTTQAHQSDCSSKNWNWLWRHHLFPGNNWNFATTLDVQNTAVRNPDLFKIWTNCHLDFSAKLDYLKKV